MPKVMIDAIDRRILQYLAKNARMPFLEIARECGISGAAIHQRVKKLDETGVIRGSGIDIDPKSLGFDVCAFIGIKISDPVRNTQTLDILKRIPEVVECHFITGKFNLLAKIYCKDNEHLMHIIFDGILKVEGILDTETFISLNEPINRQINVDKL